MLEIRSRRARMRLRTVLAGAPFLVSGVAFTSLGISQELPGVVATELVEQAMQEQVSVPGIENRRQAAIPTTLLWILGFGVVAVSLGRLRNGNLQWLRRGDVEAAHPGPDGAHASLDARAASDVQVANVVRSRPKKAEKPPEALKLPPHVLALLEKSAAARAAGRAALSSESGVDPDGRGCLDVTLPSYDPWRDED